MDKDSDFFPLFQRGEEQVLSQVYERYFQRVCYFAAKILQSEVYAEDIVSDTFRKAWEQRTKFATRRHLVNFLYLVTRNACSNSLRRDRTVEKTDNEWVRAALTDTQEDAPEDVERVKAELLETIFEKLAVLPGGEALRMSYIEGKSTKEIALALNTTDGNVLTLKSRSLKQLRAMFSNTEWLLFLCIIHSW